MPFKICTVGCGSMATAAHGPAYARYAATHPDTELAACCDLEAARAVAFRDRFGFARYYTDLDAMLEAEQPHAVCLVVPVEATCDLACRILERGYPLLMEKPPGLTVAETDRMIAAADAGSAPNQVAFNRRHTPLLVHLKRLLAESFSPESIQHIRYEMTRMGRADPDFSTTAVHGVDTVRFLAGSDYKQIEFHYQDLPRFGPTVANIFLDATFVSGATAHLSFCPVAGDVVERASVYTEGNTFYLYLPIPGSLDIPGRLERIEKNVRVLDIAGEIASEGGFPFEANGFYAENTAFFDAIRNGARPEGDLRSARQSVEVMQCIRERRRECLLSPSADE